MSQSVSVTPFAACHIFQHSREDDITCFTVAEAHRGHWHVVHAICPFSVAETCLELGAVPKDHDRLSISFSAVPEDGALEPTIGRWVAGLHAGAGHHARN